MTPQLSMPTRLAGLCAAAFFCRGHARADQEQVVCSAVDDCARTGDMLNLLQMKQKGKAMKPSGPGNLLQHRFWDAWLSKAFPKLAARRGRAGKAGGRLAALQTDVDEIPYETCSLESSDCSLESMDGKPTVVFPGGKTKCINGDDYAFAVVPGDTDKLLYYFEGGGACWEANGAFGKQVVQQCTDSLESGIWTTGLGTGVQNRDKEENPFRKYTVIEPIYCAGDAFMGNTTMVNAEGTTLYQSGYYNGQAVLDWSKKNMPKELSSLVVMGFSAGSLGTMGWADTILSSFSYETGSVIMDSYAALFPEGTQGETLYRWGLCGLPILSNDLKGPCEAKTLSVQAIIEAAMKKHPEVAFASIQSKVDSTQLWFYKGMAQSWGKMEDMALSGGDFYQGTNAIFRAYTTKFPNYQLFYVNGDLHCFTQAAEFYTATAVSKDDETDDDAVKLVDWVAGIVGHESQTLQCDGEGKRDGEDDVSYCDRALDTEPLKVEAPNSESS